MLDVTLDHLSTMLSNPKGHKEVSDGLWKEKHISHVNLQVQVYTSQILGLECNDLYCYRRVLLSNIKLSHFK